MVKQVSDDKAFWFCKSSGSIGKGAHNLIEFSKCIKTVPVESLEFHIRENKNDFETWLIKIMEEPKLAEEVRNIKTKGLKGEALKASMNKFAKKIAKSA
jgi:hypothetical protein